MRLKLIASTLAPALLGLILYWQGIFAWFQKDDFAWLGLYPSIHSPHDLWLALFQRPSHGTLRVLSERVYFIVLYAIAGLHPFLYHAFNFLTFAADTILISLVCTRLTGSRNAGILAATLWTINSVLAYELAWITLYNQLAIAFIFLLALWLLMNGRYVAQWIVFLIGFGVLELNVVYPLIATVWALAFAPRMLRKVLPMYLASAAYAAIHFVTAPHVTSGPYKIQIGASIFSALATYWKIALGPSRLFLLGIYPSPGRSAITVVFTAALLCVLISDLARKRWTTAFFASWFLLVLAPLLLLPEHIQDYYLTAALIGLAMWAADGLVRAPRPIAAILILAYSAIAIPLGFHITRDFNTRAAHIHNLIESIVADQRARPTPAVVLDNVDHEMWVSAFQHRPLRLYGYDQVFIRPSNRAAIGPDAAPPEYDYMFAEPTGARVYNVRP